MERRDREEIQTFLSLVGQASILEYYGLNRLSSDEAREAAIKKKRAWAQGQQANPKYRAEAMFLIKSNSLIRRVLIDEKDEQEEQETSEAIRQLEEKLDSLADFIRGKIHNDTLNPSNEAAAKAHGASLGLSEPTVDDRINEVLSMHGARRGMGGTGPIPIVAASLDALPSNAATVDYYEVLRAVPGASVAELEGAYRARYRWTRNLKDLARSSEFLAQLDEAWRVLRDPAKRIAYDRLRASATGQADADARAKRAGGADGGRPITTPPTRGTIPPTSSASGDHRASRTTEPPQPSPVGGQTRPPRTDPPTRSTVPPEARPVAVARTDAELPRIGRPRTESERTSSTSPTESGEHPPAPQISGRTLGISDGPQPIRERAPKLHVAAPAVVTLRMTGAKAMEYSLPVQNQGQGRMPGRVTSDVSWLTPRAPQLDPSARAQNVMIDIDPSQVPPEGGSGQITVVADYGERRTVSFRLDPKSRAPLFAAIGLLLIGVVGLSTWWFTRSPEPAAPSAGEGPIIEITIDPVADSVVADGKVLSGDGHVFRFRAPKAGSTVTLDVKANGFAPWTEVLRVGETPVAKTIMLDLVDPLDWRPDGTPPPASGNVVDDLRALEEDMDACFVGVPGGTATLKVYFDPSGEVHGLDIKDPTFDVAPVNGCIRRVVRGLRPRQRPPGVAIIELSLTLGAS